MCQPFGDLVVYLGKRKGGLQGDVSAFFGMKVLLNILY